MKIDNVVAGYIVRDNRVLLVHHKLLDEWLPVGGHIDPDETPDDALRREIREELGDKIQIDFMRYPMPRRGNKRNYALPFFVNVHNMPRDSHVQEKHLHYCMFYLLTTQTKDRDIKANENELYRYKWFNEEELDHPKINQSVRVTCREALELV